MPLLLPKQRGIRHEMNYTGRPDLSAWGTLLTSDSVAHTEPATETELIASTAFDTDWVIVRFCDNHTNATISDSLVNIKVGAAGSEVTIIENLFAGGSAAPTRVPSTSSPSVSLRARASARPIAVFGRRPPSPA